MSAMGTYDAAACAALERQLEEHKKFHRTIREPSVLHAFLTHDPYIVPRSGELYWKSNDSPVATWECARGTLLLDSESWAAHFKTVRSLAKRFLAAGGTRIVLLRDGKPEFAKCIQNKLAFSTKSWTVSQQHATRDWFVLERFNATYHKDVRLALRRTRLLPPLVMDHVADFVYPDRVRLPRVPRPLADLVDPFADLKRQTDLICMRFSLLRDD